MTADLSACKHCVIVNYCLCVDIVPKLVKNITGLDTIVTMQNGNIELTNVDAMFIYATMQEKDSIVKDEKAGKQTENNYKNLLILPKRICTQTLHIPLP